MSCRTLKGGNLFLLTKKTGNAMLPVKRSMYEIGCLNRLLRFNYVSSLGSTSAVNDIKINFLTFRQGFETVFLDS